VPKPPTLEIMGNAIETKVITNNKIAKIFNGFLSETQITLNKITNNINPIL